MAETKAAKAAREKAEAEAAAAEQQAADEKAATDTSQGSDDTAPEGDGDTSGGSDIEADDTSGDDAVQAQREDEAKARSEAEAANEEEAALLAAAPGGERTALAGGDEGSTTVSTTAGNARPASGPLDPPQADVENKDASDDDPDNRVYGDAAGPRDVHEDTEPVDAEFVDSDGNAVEYDDIFEDDGKTFVTTKVRVYEVFTFPNTTTEGKRLAYAQGRKVPRGEAENVRKRITKNAQIL